LQRYPQKPSFENDPDAPQLMNVLRKCGIYIYIYIYTMEFHSTIKKNKIILFVGKWMELQKIMLSEVSQAQKIQRSHFPS
jgi:hypothetical protein